MEKKINNKICEILLENECLNKFNETLEKYILNSNVLVFIDYLTYQKFNNKLEEIKSCALNNLNYQIVALNDDMSKFKKLLNETFGFIVCIGENWLLKQGQNFAIKNHINYGFVNKFLLKSEIFSKNNKKNQYFPPNFILVEKLNLDFSKQFFMLCDIFKYSYLCLENVFEFDNLTLKNFSIEFLNLIDFILNIKEKEILNEMLFTLVTKMGLLLQKYDVKYNLGDDKNEYKNFIKNFMLFLCYRNIFKNLNQFCLYKSRVKNLESNYLTQNADTAFLRSFLLNFKDKFLQKINKFELFLTKLLNFLKENYFNFYYLQSGLVTFDNFKNINFEGTFLKKMRYFEIFDNVFNIKCLNI